MTTIIDAGRYRPPSERRRLSRRRVKRLIALALAAGIGAGAALAWPRPSSGGLGVCGPRAAVTAVLARDHSESVIAAGDGVAGTLIEVWVSLDGRTLTVVRTLPNGLSCVIAAGTDIEFVAPAPPPAEPAY